MGAKDIQISWYNPRIGRTESTRVAKNETYMNFVSPTLGVQNDWVLVIDDVSKKYSEPGK